MRIRSPALLTLVIAALLATACGETGTAEPSPPSTPGEGDRTPPAGDLTVQEVLDGLADLSGSERREFMIEQAAAAGPIVMYASQDVDLLQIWQQEVNEEFPELEIQILGVQDGFERLRAESAAGQPVASVYDSSPQDMALLLDEGLLARYRSPEAASFDEEGGFVDDEGYWTASNFAPMVAGYNTDLMSADQAPSTLEDLADPGFDVSFGRTTIGARWVAGVLEAYGEEEGMRILEGIAAHSPTLFDSNSNLAEALGSGQLPFIFDTQYGQITRLQEAGAPVEMVLLEPMFADVGYVAIPADAPNPHGGALLYDWILSADGGQQVYVGERLGPRPDMDYGFADLDIDALIAYSPALFGDLSRHEDTFQNLFVR